MERLSGVTMLDALTRRPWRLGQYATMLADLHDRLHDVPAPSWLPEAFGGGVATMHLDLHPMNVVITDTGPVVID